MTQRSLRVSQSIKRELATMLMRDIKDDRISGLVSIVDVECSSDCRSAKVFISVFGEEDEQKNTIDALNDNLGTIRGEICRRLRLRFAPELQFKLDKSLERGAKVSELLGKIARGEV
ncbi:MAG: 30S ribosome-binding factor RbfA [Cyanobacteria bacterium]|nr:30S ribosome-binding factor RbfA [Cyanobacteriota bacterium]